MNLSSIESSDIRKTFGRKLFDKFEFFLNIDISFSLKFEETTHRRAENNFAIMITKKLNNPTGDYAPIQVKSVFPKNRLEVLKMTGWGFNDSMFLCKNGELTFTGNR